MDTLPLELHAQIFEYACTDDGSTARALALVSRYVRAAAAPYRYQSLSVAGPTALAGLVHTLEGLPAHRRRVRRLFLSDSTHTQAHAKPAPADDAALAAHDATLRAGARLLALAAPTLECLALLAAGPYTGAALLGHALALRLPRLRALALHGLYPLPHAPHATPRLERLRLSGHRSPAGLVQLGGLAAAAPALHSLHVAGLVAAASFAEELEGALGLREPADPFARAARQQPGAGLPGSLRELTLSAGAPPQGTRRHAPALARHEKMRERLEAVAEYTKKNGAVRVVVADDEPGEDVYETLKSFVRDW